MLSYTVVKLRRLLICDCMSAVGEVVALLKESQCTVLVCVLLPTL